VFACIETTTNQRFISIELFGQLPFLIQNNVIK